MVGGQCGPEPSAAIQDDLGALVRDHGLNVPLEDTAPQMHGPLGMIGDPFVVLADVDEMEPLAAVQLGLHLRDRAFLDALLRLLPVSETPGCASSFPRVFKTANPFER